MQLTLVDQEEKEKLQKKQPNNQTKKHPRNETFTDMIKLQIFYYLKPKSFTFIILIIDTIVYLISLLYDGVDISNGFLAPTQKALFDLGEIFPYYQKNSGIFGYLRIFTSIFLHANFLQFVSSIFIKVYFLQFIENQIGHLNTAKLYFQSCLFGTLFQSLISDDFGVAGATGVGVISFGLNLEYRQFQPKSGQFFYYHNHQQTQTFGLLKMLGIMLYFYLIYISYPNCLCINILGALIGSSFLTFYYKCNHEQDEIQEDQFQNEDSQQNNKQRYIIYLYHLMLIFMLFYFIIWRRPSAIAIQN